VALIQLERRVLPTRDAASLTDPQTIRRRSVVSGVISEYHHAA
jgi:hypothetical protein